MMHSRAYPPERVNLCTIAAALVLSVLLSGLAAGMGERASKRWCAESTCHVSKVKVLEQRDAYVIDMELASNSGGSEPVGN
jgi:hypothetical protein